VVDATGPGGSAEHEETPSAEEIRAYVQRMRSLPVDQVIGDVVFSLLNAAQVKLGRRDARLLIDVAAVAVGHARPYLPDKLAEQMDEALGQLRLGQVSAEGQAGAQGQASAPGQPEENDLDRVPAPPSADPAQSPPGAVQSPPGPAQPPPGSPQPPPSPPPSRLWVPGR
jgi:hypothetical protein